MKGPINIQFPVSAKQERVIQSTKKFVLALGGKQSGKTIAAALAMIMQIIRYPRDYFLIIAPTLDKLNDSTLAKFREVCDIIAEQSGIQLIIPSDVRDSPHSNEQKKELVMFNGAKIFYRSAEKLRSLEGMTLRAAWIDEAQWIEREVFEELQFRTTIKRGQIYITAAVPPQQFLHDHWLYELYLRAQAGDEDIDYIHFNVYDLRGLTDFRTGKPLLDEKELNLRKKFMPKEKFRAWVFGEIEGFAQTDKLYQAEYIHKAKERWKDAIASLPKPLYDFIARRLAARNIEVPNKAEHEQRVENIVIGVDPAGLGGDDTCVTMRAGKAVLTVENWGGQHGPDLERAIVDLYNEIRSLGVNTIVAVDTTGLGNQLPAYLAEKGVDVVGVTYNAAVESRDFGNKKAELYFKLQALLYEDFAIPPVHDLIEQILETRVEMRSGKIYIKDRRQSPDELDSLIVSLGVEDYENVQIFI